MRALLLVALGVAACSNDGPPLIGDSDSGVSQYTDDAYVPPQELDAGEDGGTLEALVFEGVCTPGETAVWHFFDFETHTPGDSSLLMEARTADTEDGLASAPTVKLADVTGADITNWTGVDVDPKLASIGDHSRLYLEVTVLATPASDGTASVLEHYRQAYDCIVSQ